MDSEDSLKPRLANPAVQPVLKEWGSVVEALRQGKTSLLLRKGGIHEVGRRFEVPHSRFWLYPTVEHQRAEWLKPEYRPYLDLQPELRPDASVAPMEAGAVAIATWATITHLGQITSPEMAAALFPFHPWSEALVAKRMAWKPQQPLFLLVLRVYQVPEPLWIENPADDRGCQSWGAMPLPALDEGAATPVLGAIAHAERVAQILSRVPLEPLAAAPEAPDEGDETDA